MDAEYTGSVSVLCDGDRTAHGLAGVTVPAGWRCTRHLRLKGSHKGTAYTNYHSPQDVTFRSKASARKELGLPEKSRYTALISGKISSDSAKARTPKQVRSLVFYRADTATFIEVCLQIPKQTRPDEAVEANASNFRLLADLTAADLPADLLQASPLYADIWHYYVKFATMLEPLIIITIIYRCSS